LVAIVVPDQEVFFKWAKENNIAHDFRVCSLCHDERVRKAVLTDLAAIADQARLPAWEYIKAIHLEPALFSLRNQCITPTFNLRRYHLRTRFGKELVEMYRDMGHVISSANAEELLRTNLTLPTFSNNSCLPYIPQQVAEVREKKSELSKSLEAHQRAELPPTERSDPKEEENSAENLTSATEPKERNDTTVLSTSPFASHANISADDLGEVRMLC